MDKNILVLGNGFDVYHDLPTKYIDFVNWLKGNPNNAKENMFVRYFIEVANINKTWVDCEREIKRVAELIFDLLNRAYIKDSWVRIDIEQIDESELNILSKIGKIFKVPSSSKWLFLEKEYFHEYYGIDVGSIKWTLRKELDTVIRLLEEYLHKKVELKSVTKRSCQIEALKPEYVITFNYTSTYSLYGIDASKVFHIHGRINTSPNNMVLGFEDDDEKDLDNIYFKKYFQRIQKLTGNLDRKKFECPMDEVPVYGKTISHFFGLSMSRTDGDMIREIEELSSKIVVYYYDQTDYESKVVNLIDVFGKEEAVRKIQDGDIELMEII